MTIKDIKTEARKKLALNMHQAIAVYAVEFTIFITLIALVVMSSVSLGVNLPAAVVMICYGIVLCVVALVGIGMINFAMVDFYLASYRCKPYNIRRLGETLVRSNMTKIFLLSLQRTVVGLLLTLCLIVPGVIYFIRTSMANYLLIANPKLTAKAALTASNKVMSGKTGSYFSLCMSMTGWYLLGVFTLGLGFIFIIPYTDLIKAVYYKRNLQGDKTVYNVVPQPVSPPYPATSAPIPQTVQQTAEQAQPIVAQSAPQPQKVAPIDTLADDDVRDMNATMRDFGAPIVEREVVEVPIMPVSAVKKEPDVQPVQQQPQRSAEPQMPIDILSDMVSGMSDVAAKPEPIVEPKDDTSIIETERVLSDEELAAREKSKKQAIESMYTRTDPQKPKVDYFAGVGKQKQNPNDFVTSEVEVDGSDLAGFGGQRSVEHVIDAPADEPVMSDSDFDEFLRKFDSESSAQQSTASAASGGSVRRAERRTTERPSSRRTQEKNGNGEVIDRAERIRREREARLNKN